jgi:hypothetical protein
VYTPTRTRKLDSAVVQHHNPVGTRYTPDYSARDLLPGELSKGAAAIAAYIADGTTITHVPRIAGHKFVDTNTGTFVARQREGGSQVTNPTKVGMLMWYLIQDTDQSGKPVDEDPFYKNFFTTLCDTIGPTSEKENGLGSGSGTGTGTGSGSGSGSGDAGQMAREPLTYEIYLAYATSSAHPADRARDVGTAALVTDDYRKAFQLNFDKRVAACGWNPDDLALRLVPIGAPSKEASSSPGPLASRVFNELARIALAGRSDYLVRVDPRDRYLEDLWPRYQIGALRALSPANYGIAGLRCKPTDDGVTSTWSDPPDIVSHGMIHRSTISALGGKYAVAWHMDTFMGVVFGAAKRAVWPEGTLTVCAPHVDLSDPTKEFIGDYLPLRISRGLDALSAALNTAAGDGNAGGGPIKMQTGTIDRANIGRVIALGISTTTRGIEGANMDNIPFFKVLLASFLKTVLPTAPGKTATCKDSRYEYRIYLGFDNGDVVYDAPDGVEKLYRKFNAELAFAGLTEGDRDCISLRALRFAYEPGRSVSALVASDVMRVAYNEGADYLYRVNDDTEILTAGWEDQLTHALARMVPPNVGVSGPLCEQGNLDILTHHMTHRTHLDLFDYYYPRALVDWFSDDYISFVYGPQRSTMVRGAPVAHRNPHGTRYVATMSAKDKLRPAINEGYKLVAKWLKEGAVRVPKTIAVSFRDVDPRRKKSTN